MLHKNTGAQDLVHFAVGWTPVVLDSRNKTKQKKKKKKKKHTLMYPKIACDTKTDWFCIISSRV